LKLDPSDVIINTKIPNSSMPFIIPVIKGFHVSPSFATKGKNSKAITAAIRKVRIERNIQIAIEINKSIT